VSQAVADRGLFDRIVGELLHGRRDIWNSLKPDAKQKLLRILEEIKENDAAFHAFRVDAPGVSETLDGLRRDDFIELPPTIDVFIDDPYYLGDALYGGEDWHGVPILGGQVWPSWREPLREITKGQYYQVIFSGSIGNGKTSAAEVIMAFDLCKLLCLRNPQQYYGSIRARPMVIALFNITKVLAEEVNYAPFRRMLMMSPFFKKYLVERKSEKWIQIAEDKLRIALGSDAIHALGEDIVAGMLDEANFRAPTKPVNQVAKTYQTIARRMESRFMEAGRILPGHLILLSSKGYATNFLEKHIEAVKNQPGVYVLETALYEMKPWSKWSGNVFRVMIGDRYHDSRLLEDDEWVDEQQFDVEFVPIEFKPEFERDCEAAVMDICGRSTFVVGAFSRNVKAIRALCHEKRRHPFTKMIIESNANDPEDPPIESYLDLGQLITTVDRKPQPRFYPKAGRYVHIDLSKNEKIVTRIDHEGREFQVRLPVVWFDFYLRIQPALGGRIDYGKIEMLIIYLRRLGFRIKQVSYDQYQSEGSQQFLSKSGFEVEQISIDRDDRYYLSLRSALYDGRIIGYDYPPLTDLRHGELATLIHDSDRRKVVKDDEGAKDVADCLAAVAHEVIGFETIETEGTLQTEAVDYLGIVSATHGRMLDQRPLESTTPGVPGMEDDSWLLDDYGS